MTTPNGTASTSTLLQATYTCPTSSPFTHSAPLPTLASTNPKDRATYLSALRKACTEMQDRVNKELTLRMEEDNARAAANGSGGVANGKGSVDDKKEEENYGEEVVEED